MKINFAMAVFALTTGSLRGQEIISQFSIPHPDQYDNAYFIEAQFTQEILEQEGFILL